MRRLRIALVSIAFLAGREALATTAADVPCLLTSPAPMPCIVNSTFAVAAGSILDFGTRALTIGSQGELNAGGGNMSIIAAAVVVQAGGGLFSRAGNIDVTTTGDIRIEASGNSRGRVDVSGPSGGFVTLTAGGNLVVVGQLLAVGDLASGGGGSIDVTGTNVTISGRVSAIGGGQTGFGGDVSVAAVIGGVTISGTIDTSAADGGSITVDSDGDLTVTDSARLDGNAGAAGSADTMDLSSFAGSISLAGVITGHAPGSSTLGGGTGADLCVDASGTITNDASIDMSGGGPGGLGGSVEFTTDGDIISRAPINVSAAGNGGYAGLLSFTTTLGMIDLQAGDLDAIGPGFGGDISAFSFNGVRGANRITADGPSSSIDLQGCAVELTATARLSSVGTNGANILHASGQMTVAGMLTADPTRVCSNDRMLTCTNDVACRVCETDHTHPCTSAADCGGTACATAAFCTSGNTLEYLDPMILPRLTGAVISPPPVQLQNPRLIPCGGFPSTTTSTSTTVTTTTGTSPSTTTATTSTTIGTTATTATATTTTATTATTTTATTSTTTTATVSTTTTTTVAPPTSTSSTQPSTTTSTTLPTAACDPPDCQDGDACTDDLCDLERGCVHAPRAGFDAISCRLDMIVGVLQTAPVDEVGGPAIRARFQAKVAKVQHMVDAGRSASGKHQVVKLKRASKLLTAFIHAVEKGQHRGKVKEPVASEVIGFASGAQSSLLPFIL